MTTMTDTASPTEILLEKGLASIDDNTNYSVPGSMLRQMVTSGMEMAAAAERFHGLLQSERETASFLSECLAELGWAEIEGRPVLN